MTSLRPLATLALMLSLSAYQVSAGAISMPEEHSCVLNDEAVAALVDVAELMEARNVALPSGLRSVFAHLSEKHRNVPADDLLAGVEDATEIVRSHAVPGKEKSRLLEALRSVRIATYTIPNNVVVNGTFTASRAATLSGRASLNHSLTCTGVASLTKTLDVTGATPLAARLL